MKKLIVILFCIAQNLISFGQYLNKSVEGQINVISSLSIEQISNMPDTFLLFSAGILNSKLNIQPLLIDSIADTISGKIYIDSVKQYAIGWANSTNLTLGGNYIMGGGRETRYF